MAHTKSNLGKKWPTTYLDLSEPCKLVKVPDPGSPSEAKEKNMRQVLKILQAADGAIGISKIMAHPNCPAVTEKSVLRYLKQLEQNGEVRRDGKGKATKYCFGTGDILSRSCPDSPQLLF